MEAHGPRGDAKPKRDGPPGRVGRRKEEGRQRPISHKKTTEQKELAGGWGGSSDYVMEGLRKSSSVTRGREETIHEDWDKSTTSAGLSAKGKRKGGR